MVSSYEVGLVAEALRRGLPVPDALLRPVLEHVLAQMRIEEAARVGGAWRHPVDKAPRLVPPVADHRVPRAGATVADQRSPRDRQAVSAAAPPPKPRSR